MFSFKLVNILYSHFILLYVIAGLDFEFEVVALDTTRHSYDVCLWEIVEER
jgi:hypothetical protein